MVNWTGDFIECFFDKYTSQDKYYSAAKGYRLFNYTKKDKSLFCKTSIALHFMPRHLEILELAYMLKMHSLKMFLVFLLWESVQNLGARHAQCLTLMCITITCP